MFTASQLVAFVISMLGMPYWYGTCVYICSQSLLNSKSKQYGPPKYSHYVDSRMSRYKKDIANKLVCMDCVGMIKGFFWTNGGAGVLDYIKGGAKFVNKYGSNGCPDKSANGMLEWCKKQGCKHGKIATLPDVPGILLFSSGHVGVYIGGGYAVEARGFNYGVVKTNVKSRSWTEWAYLPESLLKYDLGAGDTVTPAEPTTTEPTTTPATGLGKRILKLKSPNMSGDDVKEMQTRLNALGFNCGTADGVFGKKTKAGVIAFQKAKGLEADGEFGPKSLAALVAAEAPVTVTPEPAEPVQEQPTEQVYQIHGFIPDVSVYQESIDFDKFVAGNDFAIFRARVNGKEDSKFKGWAKELVARGFPFAVYDYLKLKSKEDAIAQADAMFALCYPFKPRIYYLDTEELADGMTYDVERELIKVYVQRLREWGVEIIGQYTGDSRWRNQYRAIESVFDTLWIANWGENTGKPDGITLKSAAYTDKIDLHQFTSYGYTKVPGAPGINHRIDLNQLTGKRPLSWFTGRNYGEQPTTEPESPAPVYEQTYVVQANDTLWAIAKKFLGNGAKYPEIMSLNNLTSTVIKTGMVLKIPV